MCRIRRGCSTSAFWVVVVSIFAVVSHAEPANNLQSQIEELRRSNKALEDQALDQRSLIEELRKKVDRLESERVEEQEHFENLESTVNDFDEPERFAGFRAGNLNISGSGAVGFFDGQKNASLPNSEFRVDEAKLYVEAPIWEETYFFTELNLASRESDSLDLSVGELYLDFENVSRLWNQDDWVNIRIGRADVPFGEEYLYRDAIDNPLISHSLSDIWGVDEGVELYGRFGRVSYVMAVQNGSVPVSRDFVCDKSVTGRIAYDPFPWLHLSVSAMRTGDIDPVEEEFSELWFGSGWFRSIGSTNTSLFHANLVQGDVSAYWKRGHVRAFGGAAFYDDNDPAADNGREIYYGSVEIVQDVTRKLYAAVRASYVSVKDGYPIPANGDPGRYFFAPMPVLTDEILRLTLGLGWRFGEHLVVKGEYNWDCGKELAGVRRSEENFFGVMAAMEF